MSENPPYSNDEARKIFRKAVESGSIILTKHCKDQMASRGIDMNDIIKLANSGIVQDPPEPDIKTGEWKYKMECAEPGMSTIFCISSEDKIRLITVMN